MRHIELATVPARTHAALSPKFPIETNRHAFWRAYLAWQAQASEADLASLAKALESHAQHVRPIHQAIGAALLDKSAVLQLPIDLLLRLEGAGWKVERPVRLTMPLAA